MTSHFYLFAFLPTDPISFPWCSAEQEINLVWPYAACTTARQAKDVSNIMEEISIGYNYGHSMGTFMLQNTPAWLRYMYTSKCTKTTSSYNT